MRRLLVIALIAAPLGACAPTADGAVQRQGPQVARACFQTDRITNFRSGTGGTLYVKTLNDTVYALQTAGCLDLDGAVSIALQPDFGGSSRLCTGDSAQVFLPRSTVGPNPCRVRLTGALTPAEVEALPSRDRP